MYYIDAGVWNFISRIMISLNRELEVGYLTIRERDMKGKNGRVSTFTVRIDQSYFHLYSVKYNCNGHFININLIFVKSLWKNVKIIIIATNNGIQFIIE